MEKLSGMYGQMPVIRIGNMTISEMSNAEDCKSVWIQVDDDEGGEFQKSALLPIIEKFFKENF